MHYNFVDIGTSDFQTSVDYTHSDPSLTILLVEPLKFYLDNLPNAKNIIKANVAIGAKNEKANIFYLAENDIDDYNFEQCVRGCNKIGQPHVSIKYELDRRGLSQNLIRKEAVQVITFQELCDQYNIESIGELKIDTEGYEEHIVPGVLQSIKNNVYIKKIQFENQEHLGNKEFLDYIVLDFVKIGYTLSYKDADVVLEIN